MYSLRFRVQQLGFRIQDVYVWGQDSDWLSGGPLGLESAFTIQLDKKP